MRAVEISTGRTPEELLPRDRPALYYILPVYYAISRSRSSSLSGASPITDHDITGWCRLFGARLSFLDYLAIRAVDDAVLEAHAKWKT